MSEADARLSALFAADEPPARDPQFVWSLVQRAERRRLARDLVTWAALVFAVGAATWGLWPSIAPMIAQAGVECMPPAAVVVAASSLWGLLEMQRRAG